MVCEEREVFMAEKIQIQCRDSIFERVFPLSLFSIEIGKTYTIPLYLPKDLQPTKRCALTVISITPGTDGRPRTIIFMSDDHNLLFDLQSSMARAFGWTEVQVEPQ